jgi:Fe-S-cluster containining protein
MCGACCRTFPVLVSIGDSRREPRIEAEACPIEPWNRTSEWEFKLHPLPFSRGCLFLDENDSCSVYETRPDVCRIFDAGSKQCSEARGRVGLPPLD